MHGTKCDGVENVSVELLVLKKFWISNVVVWDAQTAHPRAFRTPAGSPFPLLALKTWTLYPGPKHHCFPHPSVLPQDSGPSGLAPDCGYWVLSMLSSFDSALSILATSSLCLTCHSVTVGAGVDFRIRGGETEVI